MISSELEKSFYTAVSDSEDFGPASADSFPPSEQQARPSVAFSELIDVLARASGKLSIDWPDEPPNRNRLISTSGFYAA